jgi:cysteine desulfurase
MRVYADYNATAPVRPDIRREVEDLLFGQDGFGNASSIHWAGQRARRHLEAARSEIARRFDRASSDVIFTSGGSEADNLALVGAMSHPAGGPRRCILSSVEHPALLAPAAALAQQGIEVMRCPVQPSGALDLDALERLLRTPTRLVAVMGVNNETGVVHDIEAVHDLARRAGARLLVDGVQSVGRTPLPSADLVVISGHKLGGLKGAGALIRAPDVPLRAAIQGGPQERGLRAGTEDVPAVVALAQAVGLAEDHRPEENRRLGALRNRLEAGLQSLGATVVGAEAPRIAGTTTLVFEGVEGDAFLQALDLEGVAASSGSACSSGSLEPSHVLTAMGYSPEAALSAVRFSFGWASTDADVDRILEVAPALLDRVRASG